MEMVLKNVSGLSDCLGADINVFTGTTDCGFSDTVSHQHSMFQLPPLTSAGPHLPPLCMFSTSPKNGGTVWGLFSVSSIH